MLLSDSLWFRSHAKKMDSSLRRVLLNNYRHSKLIPCYFHNYVNKINFLFKRFNVIVKYKDGLNLDNMRTSSITTSFWKKIKNKRLNIVNSFQARLSQKKILKLLEQDDVKMIYLNRECKALLDTAGPSVNAPFAWDGGITGKGVTAAVIDTGIEPHNDLVKPVNRILAFVDFIKKKKKAYDDNGHGTHVAGDIASNGLGSGGLYKAPAYETSLVGIKALDKFGSGDLSTIIQGIEWCINNKKKYNIRIICMSLGSETVGTYKDDLLCQAAETAWKNGIVVCVAAGNEGPKSNTISSPGNDPVIITVGACDDNNTSESKDDTMAYFSSRGPTADGIEKPDLIVPGVDIVSLRAKGSYLDKTSRSGRVGDLYFSLSGTSMSTPLCCSIISLLLEKSPLLTPNEVKTALLKACRDMGYDRNTQGSGCLDVKMLLNTGIPNPGTLKNCMINAFEEPSSCISGNDNSPEIESNGISPDISSSAGKDIPGFTEAKQSNDAVSDTTSNNSCSKDISAAGLVISLFDDERKW